MLAGLQREAVGVASGAKNGKTPDDTHWKPVNLAAYWGAVLLIFFIVAINANLVSIRPLLIVILVVAAIWPVLSTLDDGFKRLFCSPAAWIFVVLALMSTDMINGQHKLVIESVSVPDEWKKEGITSDQVAALICENIQTIKKASLSGQRDLGKEMVAASGQPDVSANVSGVQFDATRILTYLSNIWARRIDGTVSESTRGMTLTITGHGPGWPLPSAAEDDYSATFTRPYTKGAEFHALRNLTQSAATTVTDHTYPYYAAVYHYNNREYADALVDINRSINTAAVAPQDKPYSRMFCAIIMADFGLGDQANREIEEAKNLSKASADTSLLDSDWSYIDEREGHFDEAVQKAHDAVSDAQRELKEKPVFAYCYSDLSYALLRLADAYKQWASVLPIHDPRAQPRYQSSIDAAIQSLSLDHKLPSTFYLLAVDSDRLGHWRDARTFANACESVTGTSAPLDTVQVKEISDIRQNDDPQTYIDRAYKLLQARTNSNQSSTLLSEARDAFLHAETLQPDQDQLEKIQEWLTAISSVQGNVAPSSPTTRSSAARRGRHA